jgi:hypothetical protein
MQSIGKHVWDSARTSPITLEDVEIGLRFARAGHGPERGYIAFTVPSMGEFILRQE